MKFWKAIMPNLCISLWLALLTLVILDQFNPYIGFLKGRAFLILVGLCALASICSAAALYREYRLDRLAAWRRRRRRVVDEDEEL